MSDGLYLEANVYDARSHSYPRLPLVILFLSTVVATLIVISPTRRTIYVIGERAIYGNYWLDEYVSHDTLP